MPIYEYEKCSKCGKKQELRLVKISERDEQFCECGNKLNRIISAPRYSIFKGVIGSSTMLSHTPQRLPDIELTTSPKQNKQ